MSDYPAGSDYRNIIICLRISDLQKLLETFNRSKSGRKSELQNRALELLNNRPVGFNYRAYLAKVVEVYQCMRNESRVKQQMIPFNVQQPRTYQAVPPNYFPWLGLSQAIPAIPTNQQVNAIAFNRHNTNTFTPSTQSLANIRLKQLPFYEVVADVMKPTTLVGNEICSLPLDLQKTGMRETTFNIKMFYEHINYISLNLDVNINEYIYQLQLRICVLEPASTEITDFMPLALQIRVNNKFCVLPPIVSPNKSGFRRLAMPIHCAEHLRLSPVFLNTITINWTPDEKTYIIAAYVVKKLSSSILLQNLFDQGVSGSNETVDNIIKKLAVTDHEVTATSYHFPLICPLGKVKMVNPAKSIKCDHLQCFDAVTFMLMNEKKPTWSCPTCYKPCIYDDIRIQQYFLNVVQNVPKSCTEIQLLADGTWEMYEEIDELIECAEDSIILDDSEDENPLDVNKEANTNTEIVVVGIVDLTLIEETQENEAQAANTVQSATTVDLKPQAQVQPQQAVTSSKQILVIEIDSD